MPKADAQKAEREERDLNTVVNHAIAATEQEVFDEALGAEPLDLDGDTSLEEMGEGLEGDDLEDEDEAEETKPELEAKEEGDEPEPEGEEKDEDEPPLSTREDDREDRGRFVPRARVKEEADKRRSVEQSSNERIAALTAQVETLTQLMARGPAPVEKKQEAAAPDPEPDMFVEPDKWKDWNRKQARKEAETAVDGRLSEFERRQNERNLEGVNESFAEAANGQRGYEFTAAYQKLTSLDPRKPENQRIVNRILRSRDPVQDVWTWWDENGGPEFRENALLHLADQYGIELPEDFAPPSPRRAVNGQRARQQQPRHETRLPQTMRSLNDARGSGSRSQDGTDPRMLDGSEGSIFNYGTARE